MAAIPRRPWTWMIGLVAMGSVLAPSTIFADARTHVATPPVERVQPASAAAADRAGAVTTTTIVGSEGPVPQPEVGPILVPASGSSFSGAWWLVAFGGIQLVGLFFITRRARARLSTEDARP